MIGIQEFGFRLVRGFEIPRALKVFIVIGLALFYAHSTTHEDTLTRPKNLFEKADLSPHMNSHVMTAKLEALNATIGVDEFQQFESLVNLNH